MPTPSSPVPPVPDSPAAPDDAPDDAPQPSAAELGLAFGLVDLDPASLTPWARVYRASVPDGDPVVVKRTASTAARADAMARWTRALSAAGVLVVTPVPLPGVANPQQVGDEWWVVYPWVEGAAYSGALDEVRAAGDLLGRLHAVPATAGLREYVWPETGADDVASDLETLDGVLTRHGDGSHARAVRELGRRWWEESLPALRAAEAQHPPGSSSPALPRAGVSSDYRATNLVLGSKGPVLVDPDNGGLEPRLLDLAMALVLFHRECPTAPGRLFGRDAWETFARAYLAHVELTATERALWPAALDHMLWEEGTWVLEDSDDDAWADPRERAYLLDLATVTPERYPLPDVGP